MYKTVAQKGILQRFLPYIWTVPDDIVTEMRKEVLSGFGKVSENQGPPLHLKTGILELYKLLKRRFESEEVGKDKLKTIEYSPSAAKIMDMEHDKMLGYIKNLNPQIRNVVRLFEMNLVEYIGKLAVLNTIAMAPTIKDKKVFAEKSFFKEFQQAYEVALSRAKPQETIDGGYVRKLLFRQVAEEVMKCSQDTVYKRMTKISELFETKKKGRMTYLKPKENKEV